MPVPNRYRYRYRYRRRPSTSTSASTACFYPVLLGRMKYGKSRLRLHGRDTKGTGTGSGAAGLWALPELGPEAAPEATWEEHYLKSNGAGLGSSSLQSLTRDLFMYSTWVRLA